MTDRKPTAEPADCPCCNGEQVSGLCRTCAPSPSPVPVPDLAAEFRAAPSTVECGDKPASISPAPDLAEIERLTEELESCVRATMVPTFVGDPWHDETRRQVAEARASLLSAVASLRAERDRLLTVSRESVGDAEEANRALARLCERVAEAVKSLREADEEFADGVIPCRRCGREETMHDLDVRETVRAALRSLDENAAPEVKP